MFEVANLDRVSWAQIGSRLFEVADFDRADRAQIDSRLFEVSSSVPGGVVLLEGTRQPHSGH